MRGGTPGCNTSSLPQLGRAGPRPGPGLDGSAGSQHNCPLPCGWLNIMQIRELFHGTNGDNILKIMRQGSLTPDAERRIFFSEQRFDSVLMHGADTKRKATFAIKVRVTIPSAASQQRTATPGVSDTLIVTTHAPLQAEVLELYVRQPRASAVTIIKGRAEIEKYLSV